MKKNELLMWIMGILYLCSIAAGILTLTSSPTPEAVFGAAVICAVMICAILLIRRLNRSRTDDIYR